MLHYQEGGSTSEMLIRVSGNVREFETCQGNVGEFVLTVRELSWKRVPSSVYYGDWLIPPTSSSSSNTAPTQY